MPFASRGPSYYLSARYQKQLERVCEASAGPHGNLTGMRKLYWGDAPVIRCGAYLYKVSWNAYNHFIGRQGK